MHGHGGVVEQVPDGSLVAIGRSPLFRGVRRAGSASHCRDAARRLTSLRTKPEIARNLAVKSEELRRRRGWPRLDVSTRRAGTSSVWCKRAPTGSTPAADDNAFGCFLAEVAPRLSAAFSAAYGPERGEDALAEAMAYAWEHREKVQGMENPSGYLYREGQSRSRRLLGRRVRMPSPAEFDLPWIEPGLVPALASLPERQRTCVALVAGHGWTHQETAELLGLSRSTVQNHVERGMKSLRTSLGVRRG